MLIIFHLVNFVRMLSFFLYDSLDPYTSGNSHDSSVASVVCLDAPAHLFLLTAALLKIALKTEMDFQMCDI